MNIQCKSFSLNIKISLGKLSGARAVLVSLKARVC